MTYHFRVSVEGSDVERILGELLVARALCDDALCESDSLDVEVAEAVGETFSIRLAQLLPDDLSPETAAELARQRASFIGPVTDRLDPILKHLSARLTVVIDYLRVDPD